MSRKCDVVVVGGGISGQSRRRPSFLLRRPDRWPPGGRGGWRGRRTGRSRAEGRGAPAGPGGPRDSPRPGVDLAGPGRRAPSLPRGQDSVRSWTEAGGGGAESQWKGWSQALSFSLRGLPGLRLGEFSRRGERGSAGERFLFGGDTKVRHFFQAKVSPLLQPDPGTVRPCWKPARTTTCYSSGSGKTTLNSSCF